MAEQQVGGSAGEMMVFGLIEQADRIGKSALATQQDLTEQIQHLGQVQEWAVNAAVELQKQAASAIKNLEAERAQLQASRTGLERNAVQAIQNAVRSQSDMIERHTIQALASPLHDIEQAAGHVRQNVQETRKLTIVIYVSLGLVIGVLLSFWPISSRLNSLEGQIAGLRQQLQAVPAQVVTPASASQQQDKKHGRH